MKNTTSPYFYPNDSWSDPNDNQLIDKLNKPSHQIDKEMRTQSPSLCPIDETDDFHDPFSDLSLFLSRKIKKVVEQNGSTKQWSSKIQVDLLRSILPEFTLRFPTYRIGLAAIRKVWEKVSYFYSKVQTQQEALQSDGHLNIDYMIKENLKSMPQHVASDLPPYHHAHQLAVKLCECIATVDGIRPSLDHLMKVIWATQKHLLKDLPLQRTKNAYEEYDFIDKMLVKTQLEALSHNPLLSKQALSDHLKNALHNLKALSATYHYESLYQLFSFIISQKLISKVSFLSYMQPSDHNHFRYFIQKQLELCQMSSKLKEETITIESAERILSLYPLLVALIDHVREDQLKIAIECVAQGKSYLLKGELASLMVTFIQAELHFLKRKDPTLTLEEQTHYILSTFRSAQNLPRFTEMNLSDLEIYVWRVLADIKGFAISSTEPLFYKEALGMMIDQPRLNFKCLVYQLVQYFSKAFETLRSEEFARDFDHRVDRKIHIWSTQNAMVFRSIHCDDNLELFKLLKAMWEAERLTEATVNHNAFIRLVLKAYLGVHPQFEKDQQLILEKITFLYHYFWYHHRLSDTESSFDRFALWHRQDLKATKVSSETLDSRLEQRILELLPLTPFTKKTLTELAS